MATYTGPELEDAIKAESAAEVGFSFMGMVKASGSQGRVSVAPAGSGTWTDIPVEMIASAHHVGGRAGDEKPDHPVFRLVLRQPKQVEAQVFASLLDSSAMTPPTASWGIAGGTFQGAYSRRISPGFGGPSRFGQFGGQFGPTLPSCGYREVVCGSSLPGYPPPTCIIYCCTYPSGMNNCSII
ncbi:hypothetical protein ABIE21_001427 [Conyzicola nivalis]|uniref:Uncharacterized protein n=1 Tax=Conyzicola nivalis TaxID=1477021 RepID=A0ABV2QN43_9MICO